MLLLLPARALVRVVVTVAAALMNVELSAQPTLSSPVVVTVREVVVGIASRIRLVQRVARRVARAATRRAAEAAMVG